jgi:hypothetical protein
VPSLPSRRRKGDINLQRLRHSLRSSVHIRCVNWLPNNPTASQILRQRQQPSVHRTVEGAALRREPPSRLTNHARSALLYTVCTRQPRSRKQYQFPVSLSRYTGPRATANAEFQMQQPTSLHILFGSVSLSSNISSIAPPASDGHRLRVTDSAGKSRRACTAGGHERLK